MRIFFILLCLSLPIKADTLPLYAFNTVAQNVTFQWKPDPNGVPRYGQFRYSVMTYWSNLPAYNCIQIDTWSPEIGTVLPANKPISLYEIVTWKTTHPASSAVTNCN